MVTLAQVKDKLFAGLSANTLTLTEEDKEMIRQHPEIWQNYDVDGMNNHYLLAAISKNKTEYALTLLELVPDDLLTKTDGSPFCLNTPLLLAIKKGNTRIATALLDKNANLWECKDLNGLTPLHWACLIKDEALIQTLLDKGAKDCLSDSLEHYGAMSAKQLYERSFDIQDYQLRPGGGGQDAPGLFHLNNPFLTDMFWHALDLAINSGYGSELMRYFWANMDEAWIARFVRPNLSDYYPTTAEGGYVSQAALHVFMQHRAERDFNPGLSAALAASMDSSTKFQKRKL